MTVGTVTDDKGREGQRERGRKRGEEVEGKGEDGSVLRGKIKWSF